MAEQRGRKPTQQQELVADFRRQIAQGELSPGTELPSQQTLMQRYGISQQTVQRALDRLAQEGFTQTKPRRGRFVATHPPCRHRFGLVFPGHPGPIRSYHWSRLFAAQLAAAGQFEPSGPCQWTPYFDAGAEDPETRRKAHMPIERDLAEHRLAGLLLTVPPTTLGLERLVQHQPVPVAVMGGTARDDCPVIAPERVAFLRRAVEHVTGLGRRRVAWLTLAKEPVDKVMREVQRANEAGDVTIRPDWILPADPYHPDWLAYALRVLVDKPAAQRPEALVVADDHLVEPAARALQDMDVAVPDDLAVVGQWNWPLACAAALPVHLLGYDATEQLQLAAKLLHTREAGCHNISVCSAAEFRGRGGITVPLAESETGESPALMERA